MNKMDEYFKKQLTDYSSSEDDNWDVPSDKVWKQALPHLPKKKESHKGLFFLLGFLLAGSIALGYFFLSQQSNNQVVKPTNTNQVNLISENSTPQSQTKALRENTDTGEETTEANSDTNPLKSETTASSNQIKTISKKTTTITTSRSANLISETNTTKTKKETRVNEQNEKTLKNLSFSTHTKSTKESVSSSNTSRKEITSLHTKKASNSQLGTANPMLDQLPLLTTGFTSRIKKGAAALPYANKIIHPIGGKHTRKEVGIGSARYLIHLLPVLESALKDDADSIKINSKIRSANIYYRKWLGPKWSIASGAYFTSLDLELYLDIDDVLDCSDLSAFVSGQLGSQLTQREGCLDEPSNNDIEIFLQDGETVSVNDSLNFVLDANLDIKGFQFPLMFTRHWAKKRIEYTVGIGASLDLVFFNQGRARLDVRRDGKSILKEIYIQEAQKEVVIDFGFYLDSGIRIPIHNSFNLGITSRINFRDPFLSGIEAGLFYRW